MHEKEEYGLLLRELRSRDKHRIKVLSIIAETNDHKSREISEAIAEALERAQPEQKQAILALAEALSRTSNYSRLALPAKAEAPAKEEAPAPGDAAEFPSNKRIKTESNQGASLDKSLPYPIEFYFYKLVPREEYASSFEYYRGIYDRAPQGPAARAERGRAAEEAPVDMEEVRMDRDSLGVRRLELGVSYLYSSHVQCKVCGLRFDDPTGAYTAHVDQHQKRSQMEAAPAQAQMMWRPWLMEPREWAHPGDSRRKSVAISQGPVSPVEASRVMIRGDKDNRCFICKDSFEIVWDDEEEDWAFKDAILIKEDGARQICHRRCAS